MAALLFIRFEVRAKLNGKRTKGVWTEAVAARSGKGDIDPHQTGRRRGARWWCTEGRAASA